MRKGLAMLLSMLLLLCCAFAEETSLEQRVKDAFTELGLEASEFVDTAALYIAQKYQENEELALAKAREFADNLVNAAKEAKVSVAEFVENVWQSAKSAAEQFDVDISEWFHAALDKVTVFTEDAGSKICDAFNSLAEEAAEKAKESKDAIHNWLGGLLDDAQDAGDSVIDMFSDLFNP